MQISFDDSSRLVVLVLLAAAVILLPQVLSFFSTPRNLRWVEVPDLAGQLKGRKDITVIDVRTQEEFTGPLGHIKKAKNIPLHEIPRRLPELQAQKDNTIILVCRTDRRASRAAALLSNAGLTDVSVLRGGMTEWNRRSR